MILKLQTILTNELPFMVELPDGEYEIKTSIGVVKLNLNSDFYSLHMARFPKYAGKSTYVGDTESLQEIIEKNNLSNYAFTNCKTFVSCQFESELLIEEDDYESVSKEQVLEKLTAVMIQRKVTYSDSKDLCVQVEKQFENLTPEEILSYKNKILIDIELSKQYHVYPYYEALNQLIRNYSYIRKHFWVQKVDVNILEGTLVRKFLDGKFYESETFAGLVPSILPCQKKYPEIETEALINLKSRLLSNEYLQMEEELILVARGLWYRLEYRSAIIESSAALEIAVEKKLTEKMRIQGKNQNEIDTELAKTETNFNQRCDVFLKKYTGYSFVKDNPTLWTIIDNHRKQFRHKIVHSSHTPDRNTTKEIINDFEEAIRYTSNL